MKDGLKGLGLERDFPLLVSDIQASCGVADHDKVIFTFVLRRSEDVLDLEGRSGASSKAMKKELCTHGPAYIQNVASSNAITAPWKLASDSGYSHRRTYRMKMSHSKKV